MYSTFSFFLLIILNNKKCIVLHHVCIISKCLIEPNLQSVSISINKFKDFSFLFLFIILYSCLIGNLQSTMRLRQERNHSKVAFWGRLHRETVKDRNCRFPINKKIVSIVIITFAIYVCIGHTNKTVHFI